MNTWLIIGCYVVLGSMVFGGLLCLLHLCFRIYASNKEHNVESVVACGDSVVRHLALGAPLRDPFESWIYSPPSRIKGKRKRIKYSKPGYVERIHATAQTFRTVLQRVYFSVRAQCF